MKDKNDLQISDLQRLKNVEIAITKIRKTSMDDRLKAQQICAELGVRLQHIQKISGIKFELIVEDEFKHELTGKYCIANQKRGGKLLYQIRGKKGSEIIVKPLNTKYSSRRIDENYFKENYTILDS